MGSDITSVNSLSLHAIHSPRKLIYLKQKPNRVFPRTTIRSVIDHIHECSRPFLQEGSLPPLHSYLGLTNVVYRFLPMTNQKEIIRRNVASKRLVCSL